MRQRRTCVSLSWRGERLARPRPAAGRRAPGPRRGRRRFPPRHAPASATPPTRWPASTPSSSAPCRRGRWSRSSSAWTCCTACRPAACRVLNPPRRPGNLRRQVPGQRPAGRRRPARAADRRLPARRRGPGGVRGARRRRRRQAAVRLRGPRHGPRQRPRPGLAHLPHPGTARRACSTCSSSSRHPGWDLRAFVLGGRVLAAMRRRANGGWRTNVAQGGTAEPVRLRPEDEELALRAAAAVGAPGGRRRSAAGPGRRVVRAGGQRRAGLAGPGPGDGRGRGRGAWCAFLSATTAGVTTRCLPSASVPNWPASGRRPPASPATSTATATSTTLTYVDFLASAAAIAPVLDGRATGASARRSWRRCGRPAGRDRTEHQPRHRAAPGPAGRRPAEEELRAGVATRARRPGRRTTPGASTRRSGWPTPAGWAALPSRTCAASRRCPCGRSWRLAADRDLVARQYANGFREVFDDGVPALLRRAGTHRVAGRGHHLLPPSPAGRLSRQPDRPQTRARPRRRKPPGGPGRCSGKAGRTRRPAGPP